MTFAAALLPLLLQYNTAVPLADVPLEAGRWVLRETAERGTGRGGVSASLLSNDGRFRLVVRCDFSYASDISIQFLPVQPGTWRAILPVRLTRLDRDEVLSLEWEDAAPGVFARDGQVDAEATIAAATLQGYVGALRVDARDVAGRRITALFDASEGHGAVRRTTSACYDS